MRDLHSMRETRYILDYNLHVDLLIRPPAGVRPDGCYKCANYVFSYDQIAGLRIGRTPPADDFVAMDLFRAALRRRRTIIDAIASNIAHDIVKAVEEMESPNEATPQ